MNRGKALLHWRRSVRALQAADLLAQHGYGEDAVSRAYYAALHAVKAALFTRDVEADSHRGIRRQFGLHLIQTGDLEKMWAAYLKEISDNRLAADYEAGIPFSAESAAAECTRAREFAGRIRLHLAANGVQESALP